MILYNDNPQGELFFAGKVNKLNSVLAAFATYEYERFAPKYDKFDKTALFDCRSFSVPTKWEAVNCLRWREQDATRNSIQMAARSMFSHKECENKTCSQLQEMMWQKGTNWNDYPSDFKMGSYWTRAGKLEIPPINRICNPVEVIFEQATPILESEKCHTS